MRLLAIYLIKYNISILQHSKKNIASKDSRKKDSIKTFKDILKNFSIQFFNNGGKPP